ncbi:CAP domain-containing protein [Rhodalgimonas zhirmunskyi]|uniref:CAP domain-containing protein n=1 Tax=Rhodalgimonas zhirmunskyi TaxID=2964767 RepID=A0AAJ1X514_9RHOB|nr:CAP domain-containing protein [Rhodoalgimonas zhirmunskyi]MDQ2094793.1 CAP domain-containing protein [Rhodoalgimonas zhirmunskyi]
MRFALRWIVVLGLLVVGLAARGEPAREVVQLTNAFRAERGLAALEISPALEAAAEAHGRDMAQRGFFGHAGSDGSSVGARVKRQGYRFCIVAENIAKGQRDARAVMRSWIGSKGHLRNLTLPKAREIGVIRQRGDIWVMVLATRMGGC